MRCDAEQFLAECGGRWPPLLKWGAGGKFICSLFVAVYGTVRLLNFVESLLSGAIFLKKAAEKDLFFCCAWLHMQDSLVEVFRSWSSEVPVIPSVCLVCHRNMYHTGHWSKLKISSWLFKIPTEIKCLRYHIISRYDSFQKPYFRGVVFRFNREPS